MLATGNRAARRAGLPLLPLARGNGRSPLPLPSVPARAVHVFNPKTNLFDLNLGNASQVRRELDEAKAQETTTTEMADACRPLLVAAVLNVGELGAHAAPLANRLWDAVSVEAKEGEGGVVPLAVEDATVVAIGCFFAVTGALDKATAVHEALKKKNAVNTALCDNLIVAYCKAGRLGDAMGVFDDSKSNNLIPTAHVFSTILIASFEAGDIEGAKACLTEMALRRMPIDVLPEQRPSMDKVIEALGGFMKELEQQVLAEKEEAQRLGLSIPELRLKRTHHEELVEEAAAQ